MNWSEKLRNRIIAGRINPELPSIPGEEKIYKWHDHSISYSEMGDGKPLLLLHGANASAWRFEIRRNIEPLAQGGYKVFAPDMPGFGKSTRLAQPYTDTQYINFITEFAREIKEREGQPLAVVAGTLMAAHAIAAAAQAPELFGPLLLICPTGIKHLAHPPTEKQQKAFKFLAKGQFGKVLFWLLTSRPSTRKFLARDAYYDKKYANHGIVEGYHRAARYPHARFAPFSFITGYLSHNVVEEWTNLSQPVAIVWGDKSKTLPLSDMDEFLRLRPDTLHHVISNTRLAPHDEQAEEFNALALQLLQQMSQAQLDKTEKIAAA